MNFFSWTFKCLSSFIFSNKLSLPFELSLCLDYFVPSSASSPFHVVVICVKSISLIGLCPELNLCNYAPAMNLMLTKGVIMIRRLLIIIGDEGGSVSVTARAYEGRLNCINIPKLFILLLIILQTTDMLICMLNFTISFSYVYILHVCDNAFK